MKIISQKLAVIALFSALPACSSAPAAPDLRCSAPFDTLLSTGEFQKYAVAVDGGQAQIASPVTDTGKARTYRTVITEATSKGPNFGGHYTIVSIGCGAATICLAIVNVENGEVYFPEALENIESLLVDTGDRNLNSLNFNINSRLLIVAGTPNGDLSEAGMTHFLLTDGELQRIKFIPVSELCGIDDYEGQVRADFGR